MGKGYWILVWDDFGAGLVLINPRLHEEGADMYGNSRNWWPCDEDMERGEIIVEHDLDDLYTHYRIIFD